MIKLLVNDLGRIVGKTEDASRGWNKTVEYGHRGAEGVLLVVGYARLMRASDYDLTVDHFARLPEYRL